MKKCLLFLLAALLLCGCQRNAAKTPETTEAAEPTVLETAAPTAASQAAEDGFRFADIEKLEFTCGGWGSFYADLTVDSDGNFKGSVRGAVQSAGEDYPLGTVEWNDFTGSFTQPQRLSPYCYGVRVADLQYGAELGREEIRDQQKWIAVSQNLLNPGEEIRVYLPGTPWSELEEAFFDTRRLGEKPEDGLLKGYAICSVAEQDGFYAPLEREFTYGDISSLEFEFCSGAGGWATNLRINADGSFTGSFHDSEMGVTGPDYPNGEYIWCDFFGQLGTPRKVNAYTWSAPITEMNLAAEPGTEEIRDGILYLAATPYGLENAEELMIYLQGAPVAELPGDYINWVRMALEPEDGALPFYGLFNAKDGTGFSSGERMELPRYGKLEDLENQEADIRGRLESDGTLTQADMNGLAMEIYSLWDERLNDLWGELKDTLDAETMAALTQEQLRWIQEKEAAAQAAGEEAGGGSMASMLSTLKAAEITKERVYALSRNYES